MFKILKLWICHITRFLEMVPNEPQESRQQFLRKIFKVLNRQFCISIEVFLRPTIIQNMVLKI